MKVHNLRQSQSQQDQHGVSRPWERTRPRVGKRFARQRTRRWGIIATLNKEVNSALADPGFKGRLTALGVEPFANSPAEFGKFVVEYTEKWRKVIKEAGLKAE